MSRHDISHPSRRRFIADSLLRSAATVAAASYAMNSRNLLAQQPSGDKVSPNEQISVAVIGVNGRGSSHIKGFANHRNTVITHLCDADEQVGYKRAEETADLQGGRKPEVVKDMRRLFDDPSIDVISIATPNHWHALASIWAIQAGKHVYVEKPVSHNVSEGRRVVQAAAKHNKIVQTGTQSRSNRGMREAIEFIHGGGVGDVRLVRGLCYKRRASIGAKGDYSVPATVDYDLWSGPAPILPVTRPQFHYDWHWQWPYGNGDLGNQGIHQMDVSRWALGANQLSNRVFSVGGRLGYEDAGTTPNTQLIVHDFGPKRIIFEVRGLKTEPFNGAGVGLIVYGSEGYVVFPSYYTTAVVYDPEGKELQKFEGGDDQHHFDNFVEGLQANEMSKLNASILEGHLSSALCHTGNISYLLGQPADDETIRGQIAALERPEEVVETYDRMKDHLAANDVDLKATPLACGAHLDFDPQLETFVSNPKADTLLTREYRKPYVVPSESEI